MLVPVGNMGKEMLVQWFRLGPSTFFFHFRLVFSS